MYYFVRAHAGGPDEPPDLEGLEEAMDAARILGRELGNALLWGIFEGILARCRDAEQLLSTFVALPDSLVLRSGKVITVREQAVRFAETLKTLEPAFQNEVWPQHLEILDEARARVAETLLPKENECFDYITTHLELGDLDVEVPVYLVVDSPYPHGFTHRIRGGPAVCFIGVTGFGGSQLFEVILHEATHALDVAGGGEGTVFADLEQRLAASGMKRRERPFRDIPHTIIFIHSAETVRRILDPTHQHYGEVGGYYDKVPDIAAIELSLWISYLDGFITRGEALGGIVGEFIAGRGDEIY
jgi:hypothetical protein